MNENILNFDEKVVFGLRGLYEQYGYSQYKMSKFEEYELYVRNKDFLISDSIITFTDTNGRLMALKPDVTLSIIKNTALGEGNVQKVYYNENVYRVSKGTHTFKEIMQVGLECIGDIDDYCIGEVLLLAARSLCSISPNCVLDISHLGIISELLDSCELSLGARKTVLNCISEKNVHELSRICFEEKVDEQKTEVLKQLTELYGKPDEVLPKLRSLNEFMTASTALKQLENIFSMLADEGLGDMLRIDFSVVNDISYYNGIVFKGFVEGVPTSILSGGQYDRLLKKMHRDAGAIGFAVYLDTLERMDTNEERYDTDMVLIYDASSDMNTLHRAIKKLQKDGERVMALKKIPEKLKYRRAFILKGNEVAPIENDA